MPESENNWKVKVLISSTLIGALAGYAAGYLLNRTADERGGSPPKIATMDAIKTTIGVIGLVRGIASLGDRD